MKNGDFFLGQLNSMSKFEGFGTYVKREDGSLYSGHWKSSKQHGSGTFISKEEKYKGDWVLGDY